MAGSDDTMDSGSAEPTDSHPAPRVTGQWPDLPGFEILGEIGRGGMGVVYRVRQVSLNRILAMKLILAGDQARPMELARFRFEAEAVAQLDHPAIVPIYETGEHNGNHYFTMKLIGGESLAAAMPRYHNSPREAARVVATVSHALDHAHRRGILHRDIKPANILIDTDQQPYVTDFGLARPMDAAAAPDRGVTQTGMIVGTPSYMAPEQAGAQRGLLTVATDVWALGAVLYELITGRPPFRGDNPLDTLMMVRDGEPLAPRDISQNVDRSLASIAMKCLRKRPAERYQTAAAVAEDLEAYLRGEPVSAEEGQSSRLMRLLMRESQHEEVMERWGRIWILHSAIIFAVCVCANALFLLGVTANAPYLVVILAGFAATAMSAYVMRFRGGPPLTPVEKQVHTMWTVFMIGLVITGVLRQLMDLEPMKLFSIGALEMGLAFGCMATLLGGSFYPLAAVCGALSMIVAVVPRWAPILTGLGISLGLLIPGLKYGYRARSAQPP